MSRERYTWLIIARPGKTLDLGMKWDRYAPYGSPVGHSGRVSGMMVMKRQE